MKVRWPLVVRRTHKWLALLVGVQVVIWTMTGFYMVAVHISIIHGDHLVRAPKVAAFDLDDVVPVSRVLAAAPGTSEVRLQRLFGEPVWRAQTAEGPRLFDARTGRPLPPLDETQIRAQAQRIFTGEAPIVSARLLTEIPPEIKAYEPPLWQVEFEGWNRPTLYLSPTTGELMSRRHQLWRIFDFAWMLHIMDYDERTDVNNPLLRVATWTALAMIATGAWLLIWAFPRRRRKKKA